MKINPNAVLPEKYQVFLIDLKGKKYLPAAARVAWFRENCIDFGMESDIIQHPPSDGKKQIESSDYAIVKATIRYPDGRIMATGFGREDRKSFEDYLQKAETAAYARALAFAGYGTIYSELQDDDSDTNPADAGVLALGLRNAEKNQILKYLGVKEGESGADKMKRVNDFIQKTLNRADANVNNVTREESTTLLLKAK